MSNKTDFGCELFVDAEVDEKSLATELAQLLGSSTEERFFAARAGYVSVRKNKEFDPRMRTDPLDGFLYYQLRIEVEPDERLGQANAVALVSKLLKHIWSQGYPAVASCSYENELPHNGGYKSPDVPQVQEPAPAAA